MESSEKFVALIKDLLLEITSKALPFCHGENLPSSFLTGKMLRTRMAARLLENASVTCNNEVLVKACAAVELVHTASLLHDDVIDRGQIRRGVETYWMTASTSQAVLTGDLFLCEALNLVHKIEKGRYTAFFTEKVREVCRAEVEQELVLRGKELDESTCIRLAREKTGPFFAFIGKVYGGNEAAFSSALEESGYLIGTAYQLADDLLDIVGDEKVCGKTLGTDIARGKFTLPQFMDKQQVISNKISELCHSAINCLDDWPEAKKGLEHFIEWDLEPVFNNIESGVNVLSS